MISKWLFFMPKDFMKKQCAKCKQTKDGSDFYKYKLSQDGYQRYCKTCDKLYKQSETGKQSKRKQERSETGKLSQKKYQQSEKGKMARDRYKQSEKGRQALRKAQIIRRTHKSCASGSYTTDEWYNLCEFYDFNCLKCNQEFLFNQLTVDHIKPVCQGGPSHIWNLQPLCGKCNSKKGNKEIDYRKTLPDWVNRDGPIWQQDTLF